MTKPLPAHKAKSLVESFNRHLRDLEVYDASALAPQELKQLLKQPNVWVAVGKSKWS